MTIRKFLPAAIALILPFAAMSITPAQAQSGVSKPHKASHHITHKRVHKAKTHTAAKTAG